MRMMKWRFKTLVKIVISVFVVTTFLVHYTNEKLEKTRRILKGIGSRDVKDMVQPFVDTFLISNHWEKLEDLSANHLQVQTEQKEAEEAFLVVVITSHPGNEERRNIIRNSWMKYSNFDKSVIVVFFCGRPKSQDMAKLQKESESHGDLIVDDFEESYYGLTVKTLRILKWFSMNLPKSKFLAKTDDDVFVNVPRLIKHLQRVEAKLKFESESFNYMGGVVSDARGPHTLNTFSKWYVPPKLWKEQSAALSKLTKDRLDHIPLANYPPYLVGNFYVIGGNTVPLLLNTSMKLPLFHLEDVFLTGFVGSELLNINLETIPNIFTTSSSFPLLNYYYAKWFTYPRDMIAYHCDNEVDIIKQVYEDSLKE